VVSQERQGFQDLIDGILWRTVSMMLTDERTSPEQIEVMRAMTGAKRLRLAERLYWSARNMKAAGLKAQHPDWPAERVRDEVRQTFLHART
jgi:hypothetical protein